ncbi:MAG TPA: hypothetical protein DEP84_21270 [Chloroflexi bacterium]|nr:hypothetical protein [Chloroflexota bacterium]
MTGGPNVILLILDTLRAKNVSCYGYPAKTTPHLDTFANENILFKHAFSAATWTIPSHASMLTGLYPSQHRIENIRADRRFNRALVTLPEALRSAGYRTAAFSQNMLFSRENHLDDGFDEFFNVDELLNSRSQTRFVRQVADGSQGPWRLAARYVRKMIAPRLVLDNMYDWIKARGGQEPFFLMANALAPHFPWTVPPDILLRQEGFNPKYLLKPDFVTLKKQWEFNAGTREVTETHRRIWRVLYDASIVHVDREVGRFLRRLGRWRGWENTIVVITADHGEMLGDYRDIVGHTLSLHDNLIHVPLIVRHPDYSPGLKVEGVVQTLDLYPSVLEWSGAPMDGIPSAQTQRPGLAGAVARASNPGGIAFAEEDYTDSYDVIEKLLSVNPAMDPTKYPRQQLAAHSATHKYLWCDDRPGEFYNLVTDPDELHNLINTAVDRPALADLQIALDVWRSNLEIFPPRLVDDAAEMDETVIERLRALGYVA